MEKPWWEIEPYKGKVDYPTKIIISSKLGLLRVLTLLKKKISEVPAKERYLL